jgi:hypothetical protein
LVTTEATLRDLDAQDRSHAHARETFGARLCAAPPADLEEARRIRRTARNS